MIFFNSKIFKYISGTVKLIVSIPLFIVIMLLFYFYLFSTTDQRLNLYSDPQGSYFSIFMLDHLFKNNLDDYKIVWESSVAFNKRGEHEEGMKRLNIATSLAPIEKLGYSGWIKQTRLKDYENALKDYHHLNKLSKVVEYPWGENVYYLMATAHQGLNNYDSANFYYEKYYLSEKKSVNIYPRAYTFQGVNKSNQKNYNEALILFNKTISTDKNIGEAYYYKAETLVKINQLDSAKLNYLKSLDLVNRNYKDRDPYNEKFLEIYKTEIEEKLNNLNKKFQN